jgi:hypothetical protein
MSTIVKQRRASGVCCKFAHIPQAKVILQLCEKSQVLIGAFLSLVMIIVQVNPSGVEEATIKNARSDLVARYTASSIGVTTILWQESEALHNGMNDSFPMHVIYGPGYVHEELLGTK